MGFARNWQNKKGEYFGIPYIEQWQRIVRWHSRLMILNDQVPGTDSNGLMDHVYACLQNCLMFRDWLSGCYVSKKAVNALYGSRELKLCRDIANGTKHFKIDKPSVDANFLTVCEYLPPPVGQTEGSSYKLTLCADGDYYDLIELCTKCVKQIENFMESINSADR